MLWTSWKKSNAKLVTPFDGWRHNFVKEIGNCITDTLHLHKQWFDSFMRTQAVHERHQQTSTKKNNKNKDFQRFQDIIDCCLYFAQQSGLERSVASAQKTSLSSVNLIFSRPFNSKEQQAIDKSGTLDQHRQWSETRITLISRDFGATNRWISRPLESTDDGEIGIKKIRSMRTEFYLWCCETTIACLCHSSSLIVETCCFGIVRHFEETHFSCFISWSAKEWHSCHSEGTDKAAIIKTRNSFQKTSSRVWGFGFFG
jgi:hypothetical protein